MNKVKKYSASCSEGSRALNAYGFWLRFSQLTCYHFPGLPGQLLRTSSHELLLHIPGPGDEHHWGVFKKCRTTDIHTHIYTHHTTPHHTWIWIFILIRSQCDSEHRGWEVLFSSLSKLRLTAFRVKEPWSPRGIALSSQGSFMNSHVHSHEVRIVSH